MEKSVLYHSKLNMSEDEKFKDVMLNSILSS